MTNDNFITEYRSSENRVPVNNELKAKLIAMAKELEENDAKTSAVKTQPVIKVNRKRRVRHIIMEVSAIAACAALCAYAIPHISDRYFSRFNTNPIPAATDAPLATQTPHEAEPTIPEPKTESVHQMTPSVNNTADTSQHKELKLHTVQNQQTNTTSQNPGKIIHPEPDAAPIDSDKQTEDTRIPEVKSNEVEITRSELNSYLDNTSKNLAKLELWDDELSQYALADDATAQYYSLYAESRKSYEASSAEFEHRYSNAEQSSLIYEGYETYTNVLEPKFDDCRSSYRKAKNYIEINIISNSDEQNTELTEAAETVQDEESVEVQETVETEESNE